MVTNIDMEFIQAFNPLYAVPIVAVIICAFIVYALGFKSPVQPPSFDGIGDEKKFTKKRRVRETQKSNKLVQNGRVNGSTVAKSNAAVTKKKDSTEKSSSNAEKAHATEKKANKKPRTPYEKKLPQEKKKESFSHDDISDDGWVQLVSKKGRKNRKNETQSSATFINKTLEANKSDDSSPIEESPKKSIPRISVKKNAGKESPKKKEGKESPKKDKTKVETLQNIDSSIDQNQFAPEPAEEKAAKDVKQSPNLEKSKIQNIVVEVSKSDNVEKQLLKEVAKEAKVIEESSKSKKKKKKNTEVILQENEPLEKISDLATEQVISETLAPKKSAITNSVTDSSPVKNNKVEENQPSEMKTSNVAFDELAGLYPETKEQKKKKKVRREH